MKWKLTENGVEIDGMTVVFSGTPSAREAFAEDLGLAWEIVGALSKARLAFSTGKADYHDAAMNLTRLIGELQKAQQASAETEAGVDALFEKPVAALFVEHPDEFRTFMVALVRSCSSGRA